MKPWHQTRDVVKKIADGRYALGEGSFRRDCRHEPQPHGTRRTLAASERRPPR